MGQVFMLHAVLYHEIFIDSGSLDKSCQIHLDLLVVDKGQHWQSTDIYCKVKDKSILFPDITFLKHIGLKHFLLKGQFHHEYDIGPTTF